MFDNNKSLLTKEVLKSISYHLSAREDCKNVEYIVDIHYDETTDQDQISVSPYITVFPGIHDRKSSDRRGVAYHVIYHHFSELFEDATKVIVHIHKDSLVHGKYMYARYNLTRRRRWVKL